ncbi:hypothetical protein TNCV_223851 [Trichonephila clavipes]|nr:hypothetical protein TNCV_223851 [Trichonephila clavipes]
MRFLSRSYDCEWCRGVSRFTWFYNDVKTRRNESKPGRGARLHNHRIKDSESTFSNNSCMGHNALLGIVLERGVFSTYQTVAELSGLPCYRLPSLPGCTVYSPVER